LRTPGRRTVGLAGAMAFSSLVALGAATPSAQPGSVAELQQAESWVSDHIGVLPIGLEPVSRMPKAYRKVVFSALSPEQKVAMRREHLESFILPEWDLSATQKLILAGLEGARLNEDQKRFIQIAIDSLPVLYDPSLGQIEREALANRLCGVKSTLFTPAMATVIFVFVGPIPNGSERPPSLKGERSSDYAVASVLGGVENLLTKAINRLTAGANPGAIFYCNCNKCSWCDCPSGVTCPEASGGCTVPPNSLNCGCFDTFPCNSWCSNPE